MSFTNTWDDTFPADTQAANQLGADIRNFKTDIRERVSSMSGADASKPTFEAGFAGFVYFATDTGKIYQWSGTGWTQIGTFQASAGTQLTAPAGTLAAPGIIFAGEPTNTGLFADGDSLGFVVDGVEQLKIAVSGAVTMGSTIADLAQSDQSKQLITSAWASKNRAATLSANGSVSLPAFLIDGTHPLVVKWGTASTDSGGATTAVNFPTAFPNACMFVIANSANLSTATWTTSAVVVNASYFNCVSRSATVTWLAIGY